MRKHFLNIVYLAIVISLFSACSTGNKFASSFGKRKYIKGYYLDMPSNSPKVAEATEEKKPIPNPIVTVSPNPVEKKISAPETEKLVKAFLQQISAKKAKSVTPIVTQNVSVEGAPSSANTVLSVQGDGRHSSDTDKGSGNSPYSVAALVFFLLGVATVIVAALLASLAGVDPLAALLIGILIFVLCDIIAIILAIVGLVKNEDKKIFAKIVLAINIVLIVIDLLLTFGHF